MKRTQVKDALRNIWKQKVSWFAVVIIAMLAVMAYLGINFASHGIAQNGNTFYDETHFRDVEILSTLLVTQDDIDSIRAVEGVADVEGVYQTSGKLENDGLRKSVDVVSLTERISTPQLLDGRLPEKVGECAVEQPVMEALGLSVGDTIRVTDVQGNKAEYLLGDEFVITGVVNHPDHAAWPAQIPGNRDVIVLPASFDREALDQCFMKAEILLEGTMGMDRFSEEYKAAVSAVTDRLETLSMYRAEVRSGEVQAKYQAELDDRQAELNDARNQLDDARTELDDGWTELAEGEQTLTDGAEQLADAKSQLQDAWRQLEEAKTRLEDAEAELAAAKAELDSGNAELYSSQLRLDSAEAELIDAWNALEDAKAEIRSVIRVEVEAVCGDTSGLISWASRADVDISANTATAMDFWITDNFKLDMNKSLEENITDFIYSDALPDEALEAGYGAIMGGAE